MTVVKDYLGMELLDYDVTVLGIAPEWRLGLHSSTPVPRCAACVAVRLLRRHLEPVDTGSDGYVGGFMENG